MIVTQAIRNCASSELKQSIDYLYIEWHQTQRRIQRLVTASGTDISIRFLGKGQYLRDGDVLYEEQDKVILVSILPCEAIVLTISDKLILGLVAYEIGNKHLPLYVEGDSLCLPYERTIYDWMINNGYSPEVQQRQLRYPLNANVDFEQHKKFVFTPPKGGLTLKL